MALTQLPLKRRSTAPMPPSGDRRGKEHPPPPDTVSPEPTTVSPEPGDVSGTATRLSPQPNARLRLTKSQAWAIAGIVLGSFAVAAIGLYLSFDHVAHFAYERLHFGTDGNLTNARLFTIGVDAGILVLIGVDLVMAWLQRPIHWIRYPVWLLTSVTVVLNSASASPQGRAWELMDYVAAGAHGVVPVLFIVVVEIGRHAIDRILRPKPPKPPKVKADRIPLHRWLLDPSSSGKMYRQMRLRGIHSFSEMQKRDQDLRGYETWLRKKYDGDLGKATEEEKLPMTMAKLGYTVDQALALPGELARKAMNRQHTATMEALERRKEKAILKGEAEAAEGVAEKETEAAIAEAHNRATTRATAAQRAAEREAEALETEETARARQAAAEADLEALRARKEATELAPAVIEKERAQLEERRRLADEAHAVAAREADAARLAREQAEDEDRTQALAKEAAKKRLAAAEAEQQARELEELAKLSTRERNRRKVMRMILNADGVVDDVPLDDIRKALNVSSTDTAWKYRTEAAKALLDGENPFTSPAATQGGEQE
ncbi:DUF2637 domain-containing protein [Streptomyces xiamenensis]|uniref:DUF2637 domain-containing protein n=1 Tax=Streptomyces xiamenensis TaxID=408015 RepID=UPI0035D7D14F